MSNHLFFSSAFLAIALFGTSTRAQWGRVLDANVTGEPSQMTSPPSRTAPTSISSAQAASAAPESTSEPAAGAAPAYSPCLVLPRGAYLHDGFYLRIAVGVAYASFAGSGNAGRTSIYGVGGTTTESLLIGGTPIPGLVVGGGLHAVSAGNGSLEGGTLDGSQVNGVAAMIGPFFDWYPNPQDGWNLGALAGLDWTHIGSSAWGLNSVAFGTSIFGGYDIWIGPQWSLGFLVTASMANAASLRSDNGDSGYSVMPVSVGVSTTLVLH